MIRVTGCPRTNYLWSVLQGIKLGVVAIDLDGAFVFFNEAAEKMLGVGPVDLDSSEWTAAYGCYLPDKITPYPTERLPLLRALRGETVTDELMYIRNAERPGGLWINLCGQTLRDERRVVIGAMLTIQDVTQRLNAEEGRESITQQMCTLIASQQQGILIEGDERRILQVNQAFCSLFGLEADPAELVGSESAEVASRIGPQLVNPDVMRSRAESLLEQGCPAVADEVLFVDGRTLERDYHPVVISGDSRVHLWQYRDTTERKKIQEGISHYKRLCSALEQTADSVLITDRDGTIEYVNPAFEETTGYRHEEVVGKTPAMLKSGEQDQEFYGKLWSEISAGRPFKCTLKNRKSSGELYWAQQTITPMRDAGGEITHYVSVLKDITDVLANKEKEAKLKLIRVVQQKFYRTTTTLPGFDITGSAIPADETGGDYFDFIELPDGSLIVVVGDVIGHGIGTTLVMAQTRALVRAFSSTSADVGRILNQVNQLLIPDLDSGQFVTMFIAHIDPCTRKLTYASAGHNPGLLLNQTGSISLSLEATGIPLGLYPGLNYVSHQATFKEPGEILFLYTDGLVEIVDPHGVQFGLERLIQHIAYNGEKPVRRLVDGLFEAALTHSGSDTPQDDMTALVVKAL